MTLSINTISRSSSSLIIVSAFFIFSIIDIKDQQMRAFLNKLSNNKVDYMDTTNNSQYNTEELMGKFDVVD